MGPSPTAHPMRMSEPLIQTHDVDAHDRGQIRVIRMARPPVNALDPHLCSALRHAITHAQAEGVHGIVLAGQPRIFSAGLDVPYLLSLGTNRDALTHAWQAFFGVARALADSRVPVAAAITGHSPRRRAKSWACASRQDRAVSLAWPRERVSRWGRAE